MSEKDLRGLENRLEAPRSRFMDVSANETARQRPRRSDLDGGLRIILASASPRRQELLAYLGLPFEVVPAAVDEGGFIGDPARAVVEAARRKARAVAEAVSDPAAIIVAADTVVVNNEHVLGKPVDAADARRMLRDLRGRWHRVVTGLVVCQGDREWTDAVVARVHMRPYADAEIEAYIARGEPFDKAGSYAIQDPVFDPTDAVEGCTMTVVGLPLCHLHRLLTAADVSPADPRPACQRLWTYECRVPLLSDF